MSKPFNDESGNKYYMLKLIKLHHKDRNWRPYYACKCDCGKEVIVRLDCMKSGNTKSCGCLNRKLSAKRLRGHLIKHGCSGTRLYKIWQNMHDRCRSFGTRRGKDYADKGVRVCSAWKEFKSFKDWALSHGYKNHLTIDRINPTGDYEPDNCRWITRQEQQRNRRNSIYINYDGKKLHLKEWAEVLDIKYHTLFQRYQVDKSPEYILAPYRHGGKNC